MISQPIVNPPSIINVIALVARAAFVALAYASMARLGRRLLILVATAATVGSTVFSVFQIWHYAGGQSFLILWPVALSTISLFGASAVGVLWHFVPGGSVLRATVRGTAAACVVWLGGVVSLPLLLALLHTV